MSANDARRKEQLLNVVDLLASLIRNIALKKALHRADAEPFLNFWRLIFANELDVSVLEWSKLFGSDDEERQPAHWNNVVANEDDFRAGLLAALGIDAATWAAYWHEMKKYRDTHVAHHDPRRGESLKFYPKLDLALASACYYYDHVRADLMQNFSIDQQPSHIRGYAHDFEEQCVEIASAAMTATAAMKEKVI